MPINSGNSSEPTGVSNSPSAWEVQLTAIRNVGYLMSKNVVEHFIAPQNLFGHFMTTVLGSYYSAKVPAIMIPGDESSFGHRHGSELTKFAVIEGAMKWIAPVFNNLIFSPAPSELSGESKSSWAWNDPVSMEKALRQFISGIVFEYPIVAICLISYPERLTPGDKLFFDPKNYGLSYLRYGFIGLVIIVGNIVYNYLTVSPASSPPKTEL